MATADGNINGTIRFGANTSYMHPTTGMHEIAHTMGVGQSEGWFRSSVGGVFTGDKATTLLKSITGQSTDVLHSDSAHFWPFGLNYQSKVRSRRTRIM